MQTAPRIIVIVIGSWSMMAPRSTDVMTSTYESPPAVDALTCRSPWKNRRKQRKPMTNPYPIPDAD